MNEDKRFNLYEEDKDNNDQVNSISEQASGNLVSDSIIVYIDFTKPLPELIKPIREAIEDKPEGYQFGIYIICGYEFNQDIPLFIDYLNSIDEIFKIRYYFRGLIHPEFMSFLFTDDVYFQSNVKFVYKSGSLHEILKGLLGNSKIFNAFIQRFIDSYNEKTFHLIDLTELETIGFKINKF